MPRVNNVWFRKDTGWWMVTLNGRKVRLVEGRKNRKLALQKFHELKAVTPQAPESASARVADVVEAFLAWGTVHLSAETMRNYDWYGQLFCEHSGFLPVLELKPIHVTRWVDERKWTGTTERNARRSIHRAFSWAVEQGVIPRRPLAGMKCPPAKSRNRVLTDAEDRALLRASDPNFRTFLFTLRETGARPKELRTLRWGHVREDRWVLPEHQTEHKVHRPRVIFLSAPVRKLMAVLRRRSSSDHVFLNKWGKPWTCNAVRLRIMRIKQKHKDIPSDVCAYLARHAFGTAAVLNGCDVATVAELMGHADLEMVSTVYVHLADQQKHLLSAVEKATGRHASPTPSPADRRPGG